SRDCRIAHQASELPALVQVCGIAGCMQILTSDHYVAASVYHRFALAFNSRGHNGNRGLRAAHAVPLHEAKRWPVGGNGTRLAPHAWNGAIVLHVGPRHGRPFRKTRVYPSL